MKIKSIKKNLILGLLVLITLSTLLGTVVTYYELKEEMDELFDQNMKQIAHAIAVHNMAESSNFISGHEDIKRTLKGEEEFLIQIWNGNELNFSSKSAIQFPNQGEGGVKTVLFENEEWRYYALNAGNNWLVQVSQPIPMRHTVIWEIYFEQLIPSLIELPILIGLVWIIVGFGFAPLRQISESIQQRNPDFLEQLSEANAPKEILTLIQAINGLLKRLFTAFDMQQRFTADAAHELRTPLTAVRLELDILKRSETEEEKQQSLQKLYCAVDRSAHLVNQLLELARLEPKYGNEHIAEVYLHDLVKDIVENMMLFADQKNIELDSNHLEKISVQGNSQSLSILVNNLISNAIQYTPQGGKVVVSVSKRNDQAVLSVSDNGYGIPKTEQSRIFDRFYRILDKRHAGVIGSGLGLSIVKSVADTHKATINILDGIAGKGVTFEVVFPHCGF